MWHLILKYKVRKTSSCTIFTRVMLRDGKITLIGAQPDPVPEAADRQPLAGERNRDSARNIQPRLLGSGDQPARRLGGLRQDHADLLPVLHSDARQRVPGGV